MDSLMVLTEWTRPMWSVNTPDKTRAMECCIAIVHSKEMLMLYVFDESAIGSYLPAKLENSVLLHLPAYPRNKQKY